ncbi:MAG: type VI secretion system protein TssA [Gammaproteobacteria bacterium]|nr:type VI secretion system protein TssA [Gammaproteobacteria bacterium]
MPVIDIETLVRPLADDAPCGPDLEYEGITALEDLATIVPERQVGDTIEPGRDPDWPAVRDAALALFERTRDLRVGVHLATALLRTSGWEGWADGLELLARLCDEQWEAVHPQLDPFDDFDPAMREGTLGLLAAMPTLRAVRLLPLARSPRLGIVSARSLQIARGEVQASEDEPELSLADVQAVFRDCDNEEGTRLWADIGRAAGALSALTGRMSEHGSGQSVERLVDLMGDIQAALHEYGNTGPDGASEAISVTAGAVEQPVAGSSPQAAAGGGALTSRGDVVAALDRIIAYYARHEPSSPVPVLLTRARTLVGKDFWEIVNDLVPGGRSELEVLRGSASTGDYGDED